MPFKITFMTWSALNDKVPTDEKVARFDYNIEARCYCCQPPLNGIETMDHLFYSGNLAQVIWTRFAGLFGIKVTDGHLGLLVAK